MATSAQPVTPSAPPGWAVSKRPLRVAILGWARLSMQAREGSGYNLNASELASGLVYGGHTVTYLRSGMDYALLRGPHIRLLEHWRGVDCYGLFNSTNLSPASTNFRNMSAEISAPRDNDLVLRWLDEVRAQVVHVHALEGFALDLIGAMRATGRPVVVTPHNYWYGCPQVDLLHEEKRVCTDYDGGRRCVGCLEAPVAASARRRRAFDQSVYRLLGPFAHGMMRHAIATAKQKAKSARRGASASKPQTEATPDPEAALGFGAPEPPHAGLVHYGWHLTDDDRPPGIAMCAPDLNEQFLRADHHLKVLHDYGKRRVAGIAALNHASLVTPPSRFVLDVMHTMGLERHRGRHVRLGQPHFDALNRKARRSPYYDVRPWNPVTATGPLRFGFFGTTRNNKGLDVLARAVPLLEKSVRQRCHFAIRASGHDWSFRKRLAIYPEVSFLGGYDPAQLPAAMDEIDAGILPHVWFENSPLVLLEYLHAGKFVISSRLGGPTEWIVEPGHGNLGNGLLFPAGHPDQLAAAITRLVVGEIQLPSPREVHAVSILRSYPDHVREVEDIYCEVLGLPRMPADRQAPDAPPLVIEFPRTTVPA